MDVAVGHPAPCLSKCVCFPCCMQQLPVLSPRHIQSLQACFACFHSGRVIIKVWPNTADSLHTQTTYNPVGHSWPLTWRFRRKICKVMLLESVPCYVHGTSYKWGRVCDGFTQSTMCEAVCSANKCCSLALSSCAHWSHISSIWFYFSFAFRVLLLFSSKCCMWTCMLN